MGGHEAEVGLGKREKKKKQKSLFEKGKWKCSTHGREADAGDEKGRQLREQNKSPCG